MFLFIIDTSPYLGSSTLMQFVIHSHICLGALPVHSLNNKSHNITHNNKSHNITQYFLRVVVVNE